MGGWWLIAFSSTRILLTSTQIMVNYDSLMVYWSLLIENVSLWFNDGSHYSSSTRPKKIKNKIMIQGFCLTRIYFSIWTWIFLNIYYKGFVFLNFRTRKYMFWDCFCIWKKTSDRNILRPRLATRTSREWVKPSRNYGQAAAKKT